MIASVGLLRTEDVKPSNIPFQYSNEPYKYKEAKDILHFVFSMAFDMLSLHTFKQNT